MIEAIPDILARIVAKKRDDLAGAHARVGEWERRAELGRAERRDFGAALKARTPAIIAEVKKASPSKGVLTADFDPVRTAVEYQCGGAAALSVLTDEAFRRDLKQKGLARARQFSWEESVRRVRAIYGEVATA